MTTDMEIKLNHHPEAVETQDALDRLIIDELGQRERWRGLMQGWELQQLRRRRMRLLPVLSNIASVAALMIVGFVLQALFPKTTLADRTQTEKMIPAIEQWVSHSDSAASENVSDAEDPQLRIDTKK